MRATDYLRSWQRTAQHGRYVLAAVVSLVTLVLYLPAIYNEFVSWDDGLYVVNNVPIRSMNVAFFKWAMSDLSISYWHPATWFSHALDYALWGLNPAGHHLTNVVLHSANTFVVMLLIIKLLELSQAPCGDGRNRALLTPRSMLLAGGATGLLFGIHPLHVESVAWVSMRKDLLCALFYLLSILSYVSSGVSSFEAAGVRKALHAHRGYVLSFLFFLLALASKPMAVSLPVVLLIVDWHPLGRISSGTQFRKALIEKLPFVSCAVLVSFATFIAQQSMGVVATLEAAPLTSRILVAIRTVSLYLERMIAPRNLLPLYPQADTVSFTNFAYPASLALLVGVTMYCIRAAKREKTYLAAWAYYLVTLAPVLGIIRVGSFCPADRYTYLPSIGPFLIIGLGMAHLAGRQDATHARTFLVRAAVALAALLAAVALFAISTHQISIWKNSLALWDYVIEKAPLQSPTAYNNRGMALEERGDLGGAIADYNTALALDPFHPFRERMYNNRGIALYKSGRLDEAIEDFTRAIKLKPIYAEAYNSRGVAYEETDRLPMALEDYNAAIRLNPAYSLAYDNRGLALIKLGRFDEALASFDAAIARDPTFSKTFLDRGDLHTLVKRGADAARDYEHACRLGNEAGCKALYRWSTPTPGTGR